MDNRSRSKRTAGDPGGILERRLQLDKGFIQLCLRRFERVIPERFAARMLGMKFLQFFVFLERCVFRRFFGRFPDLVRDNRGIDIWLDRRHMQRRNLALPFQHVGCVLRAQFRRRKSLIQIINDVVGLDVNDPMMNERGHRSFGVDPEVFVRNVLFLLEINVMTGPVQPLLDQRHPHAHRAIGNRSAVQVQPLKLFD